jgi:hypothetical protein
LTKGSLENETQFEGIAADFDQVVEHGTQPGHGKG